MKKLISVILLSVMPVMGMAAGGGNVPLESADYDLSDQASLQRGAKYFVNYCMGCHSAQYVRYEKVAEAAGLTEEEVKAGIRARTLANEIVPVLGGSAFKNKGVQAVLDAVVENNPINPHTVLRCRLEKG